ncbi:type VI lipase adapter Tla3 domain-containing protein, partial [Pseudomonas sp. UM16]
MKVPQQKLQTRPRLRGYFWTVVILTVAWLGFTGFIYYKAQVDHMNIGNFSTVVRWGIVSIVGALALIYAVHWWANAVAHEKAKLAAYKAQVIADNEAQRANYKQTYALEIRGSGIAVDYYQQSELWTFIQRKNNNFTSIYSRDPLDYEASVNSREITQSINIRAAFKYSAGNAVAYWPIPTFAIAPPKQPDDIGVVNSIV